MTPVGEGAREGMRFLEVVKDLPLWVLIAIAVAVDVFLVVPELSADLSKEGRPWFVFGAVLFTVLAIARGISVSAQWWRARKASAEARRTFHLTPIAHQCHWSASKQSDDSVVTQIAADFMVKNRTKEPLGLVTARVIKPVIRGEVLRDVIFVRAPDGRYGSARASDRVIPPGKTLAAQVVILIRGRPQKQPGEILTVTFGIADDEGNEQRAQVPLRGIGPPSTTTNPPLVEAAFSIADPLEKEVVSVLQSEMSRYDKCGRSVGGLGSVHIVYQGHAMAGVGGDSWNPNSPKNQSIVENPEAAALHSDNLDAMLALHASLTFEDDRKRFVATLFDRLDEKKGYLRVSYFIVCVLWKVGHLADALRTAKRTLPQGEIKVFGLSNVLMMLNGLLRYRHPDFSAEMLDEIESFIHGLNEHTFMIAEKITAIRTIRLLASTSSTK